MARFRATENFIGLSGLVEAGTSLDLTTEEAKELDGLVEAVSSAGQVDVEAAPGILAQAIEALRTAEPAEIRLFFKAIGEDGELQAKIESVMDETAHGVIAIGKLDRENPEHFTKSGVPRTDALEAILDRAVSSDQRDAWWEDYQEAQKQGDGE